MPGPQLNFRKPAYIMHDEAESHSGKYWIFLGHHYHTTAHECWVIGAINVVTGVSQEWHINQMPPPERQNFKIVNVCKDPKGEALIEWERFKAAMLASPSYPEETDDANKEWDEKIKPFLQRERKRHGVGAAEPKPGSKLQ